MRIQEVFFSCTTSRVHFSSPDWLFLANNSLNANLHKIIDVTSKYEISHTPLNLSYFTMMITLLWKERRRNNEKNILLIILLFN
jgi:hypothetical protein